jgi:tryptophan synthase alpha chain
MTEAGAAAVTEAIRRADGTAICAYITAGYPSRERFPQLLESALGAADVVEVGVPFSDPMADGLTIQRTSRVALEQDTTLSWILEVAKVRDRGVATPLLLMGYYNPFLAFGLERLVDGLVDASISGLIIPDLPHEESESLRGMLEEAGLALVPLVAPTTPIDRMEMIASNGGGFLYAVTTTGVTGGESAIDSAVIDYLDRVTALSPLPVLAGFGLRTNEQVAALADHADGAVIGSALIDAIDSGQDISTFITSLRPRGQA